LLKNPSQNPCEESLDKSINKNEFQIQLIAAETSPKIGDTWDLLNSKRMFPMLPVFLASAYSVALFSAMFIPFMAFHMEGLGYSDAKESKVALLAMCFLGAGEIIGGIVFGRI
jgi:hypothetical protein